MATLTIRNIDDTIKEGLRVRAALHGHSMEEEVRVILRKAVGGVTGPKLLEQARALFAGDKGVDLALPDRSEDRAPPSFD